MRGELFGLRDGCFERLVVYLVRRSRTALLVDPDGDADTDVFARAAGGKRVGRESQVRIVFAADTHGRVISFHVAQQLLRQGFASFSVSIFPPV